MFKVVSVWVRQLILKHNIPTTMKFILNNRNPRARARISFHGYLCCNIGRIGRGIQYRNKGEKKRAAGEDPFEKGKGNIHV